MLFEQLSSQRKGEDFITALVEELPIIPSHSNNEPNTETYIGPQLWQNNPYDSEVFIHTSL